MAGGPAVREAQRPAAARRRERRPHAREDRADHGGQQRSGPCHGRRAAAHGGAGDHGLPGPRACGGGGGSAPPRPPPGWGPRAGPRRRQGGAARHQRVGPRLAALRARLLSGGAPGVGSGSQLEIWDGRGVLAGREGRGTAGLARSREGFAQSRGGVTLGMAETQRRNDHMVLRRLGELQAGKIGWAVLSSKDVEEGEKIGPKGR